MIAGVGGDIGGYNLYAYCQNNPVNMIDQNGRWGKLFKEIGNRLKYVATMMIKTVTAPFRAAKVSAGGGVGIGANVTTKVKNVKVEVGASTSITSSVSYDKGKKDLKSTTSTNVGVNVADVIDAMYSNGKEHSFYDEKCKCDFYETSYRQQMKCLANSSFSSAETTIGISIGLYLGIGGELSIGIDVRALHDDLINVFTEPYVGYY